MPWKFFLGACFLTACLVTPQAGLAPFIEGAVLAGAVIWLRARVVDWSRARRGPRTSD